MILVLKQGLLGQGLGKVAERFIEMDQRFDEFEPFLLWGFFDVLEIVLVELLVFKRVVSFECVFILFFHEKQAGFEKKFPLVDHGVISVNVLSAIDQVVGLVEVFIFDFDF